MSWTRSLVVVLGVCAGACGSDAAGDDDIIDAAAAADADPNAPDAAAAVADANPVFGADANPACDPDPVAPGAGSCPGDCTGGCTGTLCTIDCENNNCDGDDIVCPEDFDCLVICGGADHCDSGTITCPPDYGCTVQCTMGNDACGDQQIECGAGPCLIECAPDTCNGAQVNCGDGACGASCGASGPGDLPQLDCGGSCDCTEC